VSTLSELLREGFRLSKRANASAAPNRWRRLLLAGLLLSAAVGLAAGLSLAPAEADDAKIKVVATTSMIADAAREIGGDRVSVTALMGPGVDPHSYRQTRSDIVKLVQSDVVLWNGLYLEAQMDEFFADLKKRKKVYAVAEALPAEKLLSHQEYRGRYDPHVWMDPDMWSKVVSEVRDRLISVEPGSEALFTSNATAYLERISQMGRYVRTSLASVPEGQRVMITAHDAFNYFGRAYGFDVVGIQGISTESEAGLNRIKAIVDDIVARKIRAVFIETSVADRNIRAVIEGAAARGHKVEIGGELFSDAMGRPGTYEGTYIGMIDHNVTVITRALGGEAPERGMAGRLTTST
jgi:manganese/zinc/iron transport system substrate-binding protein